MSENAAGAGDKPADHADPVGERRSERTQTDESLRVEREAVDQVLEEELAVLDETADAVVTQARERADDVLNAARARSDHTHAAAAPPPALLEKERLREDQIIQAERDSADDILREERSDHGKLLSRERADTDDDLHAERERSDHALATRDEFMSIVSHDLRNLLDAIVSSAALIAHTAPADPAAPLHSHVQRIQRAATRMTRLVGDLVDVASLEAGRLAVTRELGDPSHIVIEAAETFQAQAAARGVTLVTEAPLAAPAVLFDPARILQVLTNLLSNALKFTPAPGTVVIRVERAGGDIRFAVSDTGVGMPTEQLEAVFERFMQITKNDRRGVGLGLFISRAIVESHGGKIWAEHRMGGGSIVSFTLPLPAETDSAG